MKRASLLVALVLSACKGDLEPVEYAEPDTDADADADSDTDTDTDTDSDVDTDTDTDTDADSDTDTDTDTDTDVSCVDDASEPNDGIPVAWPLTDGAYVVSGSSPDFFRFDLPASGTATITADFLGSNGDLDLYGLSPVGAEIAASEGAGNTEEIVVTNSDTVTYTFYAEVDLASGTCLPYTLTAVIDAPPPCVDDLYEPNETVATASFTPNPVDLAVTTLARYDHVSFFVPAGETRTVNAYFSHAQGNIDLFIHRPTGGVVVPTGISQDDDETVTFTNSTANGGNYVAEIELFGNSSDCNTYTLEILTP